MKTVTLSLETAKEMYNSNVASLKAFALENYTEEELKELPKSWNELGRVSGYYITSTGDLNAINKILTSIPSKILFPTKELAQAALALAQLLQLRDHYNNGWVPDLTNRTNKFVINVYKDKIEKDMSTTFQYILSFKTMELRDAFFNNFQDLLNEAKPLL